MVSCAPYRVLLETGLSDPLFGTSHLKDENSLQAAHLSARIEGTTMENAHIAIDMGLGPEFLSGWALGITHLTRIRYKMHPRFHPYLVSTNGVLYTEGWPGSDVSYTFTTAFGAGAQFNLRPELSLTLDYRVFHHSNGMTFHGDRFRQLFGLSKPSKNEGYQSGALFLGVLYEF